MEYLKVEICDTCDVCGTELIYCCFNCGAPVCCPKCCRETTNECVKYANAVQAAADGLVQIPLEH
jgi:hypothetical protein